MPKFMPDKPVEMPEDVWLVNPEGVVVCVPAGVPEIVKADKGIGGWKYAESDQIAKAKREDAERAKVGKARAAEMEEAKRDATVLAEVVKEVRKTASGAKKRSDDK